MTTFFDKIGDRIVAESKKIEPSIVALYLHLVLSNMKVKANNPAFMVGRIWVRFSKRIPPFVSDHISKNVKTGSGGPLAYPTINKIWRKTFKAYEAQNIPIHLYSYSCVIDSHTFQEIKHLIAALRIENVSEPDLIDFYYRWKDPATQQQDNRIIKEYDDLKVRSNQTIRGENVR
jgi:hypothetical protein